MKISHRWLLRYLSLDASPEAVAERITLSGFPVDHVLSVDVSDGVDRQLDVEVTWNRPDCQSHLGVAREVAGLLGAELVEPDVRLDVAAAGGIDVFNDAPDACPLYTARVVRGVRVGPSPQWLIDLLEAVGQRSVNNVVDVTNFVMLECGQPLHAFDLERLEGARVGARPARGERFTAIDGTEHELTPDDLVIADAARPVALAGVMGGRDSEVGDETRDVVLEAALFDPVRVRGSSRRHRLSSESSFRFERHVDPAGVRWASDRAAALLVELCGARSVGPIVAEGSGVSAAPVEIRLRTAQVERVFGLEIAAAEIRTELRALGLEELHSEDPESTRWRVPSRRPDLRREIDLVEEVVRRIGFDRVPERVAIPVRPLQLDPDLELESRLRDTLVADGFSECRTAPFVASGATDCSLFTDATALVVQNPVRAEENLLRRSVLGGLLRVARGNRERGNVALRLFESAPVYLRSDDGHHEERLVGALVTEGYHSLKGSLERVLDAAGVGPRVRWEGSAGAPFHRDRSAGLELAGERLGWIGELRPGTLAEFSLAEPAAAFEIRLGPLFAQGSLERTYRPLSPFPAVHRDLAWLVPEEVRWGEIAHVVQERTGPLLSGLVPFDVYRGTGVPDGWKSVAFRMELRPRTATFTGDRLESITDEVVAALAHATGGRLRS